MKDPEIIRECKEMFLQVNRLMTQISVLMVNTKHKTENILAKIDTWEKENEQSIDKDN